MNNPMKILMVMGAVVAVSVFAEVNKPNVLLFISDDQYLDSVGAYGKAEGVSTTPHIDAFANFEESRDREGYGCDLSIRSRRKPAIFEVDRI